MSDARLFCPTHGVALEKVRLTQGEGKDEVVLGYLWTCPASKDCDYCLDADEDGNPIFEEVENA